MDDKTYVLKDKSTKCILSYIIVILVLIPIIYMTFSKMTDNTTLLQVILNILSYVSLSVVFIIILRKYLFNDLKSIKTRILIDILVVIGGVLLIKGSEALCSWFYKLINQEISGDNQDTIVESIEAYPIMMFLSTVIFAPFVEEIIFRKCIFSYFKKDLYGALVSITTFALIHVFASLDFIHILPYIFAGTIFSLSYILSKRNIWISISVHTIVNLISFIVLVI